MAHDENTRPKRSGKAPEGDRALADVFERLDAIGAPTITPQIALPVRGEGSPPELATGELLAATDRLFRLGVRDEDSLFVNAARLVEALRYATESPKDRKLLARELNNAANRIAKALGKRELLTPTLRDRRVHVRGHVVAHIDLLLRQRRGEFEPRLKASSVTERTIATIAILNGAPFAMGIDRSACDLDAATSAVHTALANPKATADDVLTEIAREYRAFGKLQSDKKRKRTRRKGASRAGTMH